MNEAILKPKPINHQCGICEKVFTTKRDLLLHQYIHKEKPNFTCVLCNKTFPNEGSYKRHARVHNRGKKVITCKICEEVFDTARELEDHHRKNHLHEKKFQCETCGAEFSWRDNLLKHERMHAAETHICDVCNKGFMDSTSLRVHVRTQHANSEDPEKPFICGICKKAFKFDFSYEAHLNAHERPSPSARPGSFTMIQPRVVEKPTKNIINIEPLPSSSSGEGKEIILEIVNMSETGQYENQATENNGAVQSVDVIEGAAQAETDDSNVNQSVTIVVNQGQSGETNARSSYTQPSSAHAANVNENPGPSKSAPGRKRKRDSEPLMFDFVMSEEKPYACLICGQEFRWEISLQIHMKSHEVGYTPPGRGRARKAQQSTSGRADQRASRIVGKREDSDSELEAELEDQFVFEEELRRENQQMILVSMASNVTIPANTVLHSVEVPSEGCQPGHVPTLVPTLVTEDGQIISEGHGTLQEISQGTQFEDVNGH